MEYPSTIQKQWVVDIGVQCRSNAHKLLVQRRGNVYQIQVHGSMIYLIKSLFTINKGTQVEFYAHKNHLKG
jgi:hypothetical protein